MVGVLAAAGLAAVSAEDVPLVPIGVAAGVEAGNEVNGVGSGGSGFDKTEATNSFMPSTV